MVQREQRGASQLGQLLVDGGHSGRFSLKSRHHTGLVVSGRKQLRK